jgi:hypothetical protein
MMLLIGFAVNLAVALLIVRGIYYQAKQGKNSVFTFIAFNTVIYFVMTFLSNTELSVGVGFGLFAIFSILRYRTSAISTREMTYLFILIALPVMNSVLMTGGNWPALLVANGVVIAVLYLLERGWGFQYEGVALIKYDRIELISPRNHRQLFDDLCERTGLPVKRFEIGRINFVEDTVEITLYYDESKLQEQASDHSARYVQESYLPVESN